MPLLKIQTNQALDEAAREGLIRHASAVISGVLGKPESYVMVALEHNPDMLFAGSNGPLAYMELKSIGLPEASTPALSGALCGLMTEAGVEADRVYIEFTNAPRHLWGWNSATF